MEELPLVKYFGKEKNNTYNKNLQHVKLAKLPHLKYKYATTQQFSYLLVITKERLCTITSYPY